MRMHRSLAVVIALLLAGMHAHAAEVVMLANGFTMRCHHHAALADKVRLFLDPAETNFIDLRSAEVSGFAAVADEPPPAPPQTPAARKADAKLSPTDLHQMLNRAGEQHNLNVEILASVVHTESNGNARAVSRAGARGLMQLMPATAAGLGVHDSFEPSQNVNGGAAYLDQLLTRYNDNLSLALAAYNAGPAAVDKYHGIPPYHETRAYVARIIHEYNRRILAQREQARRAASQVADQREQQATAQ